MKNFGDWWEKNKILYEPLVTKEVAHLIWSAACDILTQNIKDHINGKN